MSHRRWWLAAGLTAMVAGCASDPPIETERPERGTLGEETFEVFCVRFAAEEYPYSLDGAEPRALCRGELAPDAATPARTAALVRNRARLVDALDRAFPEEIHDELGDFLLQLVALYDMPDERLPELMREVAALLDSVAADPEATAAIARLVNHDGYRALPMALGTLRPIFAYPELRELISVGLAAFDEGGAFEAEWEAMLTALALEAANYEGVADPSEGETSMEVIRELLFAEDVRFSAGEPVFAPIRDQRGVAVPATVGGALPSEFSDADADGLADLNTWLQYVGSDGSPLMVPTPFTTLDSPSDEARDTDGRALRDDGSLYWQYVDGDPTLLAASMRETVAWFNPEEPTLERLLVGAPSLMGDVQAQRASYGSYELAFDGFGFDEAVMLDMLYAMTPVLESEHATDALTLLQIVVDEHPEQLAYLAGLVWFVVEHTHETEHQLVEGSTFWDDMRDLLVRIANEEGLLEDVLLALGDPLTVRLGDTSGSLMRTQDVISYDPANLNGPPVGRLQTPVAWASPDAGGNVSNWQRTLEVINDLNGAPFCNKDGAVLRFDFGVTLRWPLIGSYDRCELTYIENMALFYTQAILGRAELEFGSDTLTFLIDVGNRLGISVDELLEDQTGVEGVTQHPTPQGLNRLVFGPWNDFVTDIYEEPLNIDGEPVKVVNAGTVWAWEYWEWPQNNPTGEPGFYEGLEPLLQAFDGDARFGSVGRNRLDLFLDFVAVMHRHWPSPEAERTQSADPSASFYAIQSDVRSYESLVADLFVTQPGVPTADFVNAGQAFVIVADLVQTLESVEVRPGVDGVEVLAALSEDLLLPSRACGGPCGTVPEAERLATRDGRTLNCRNDGTCRSMGDGDIDDPEGLNVYMSGMSVLIDALREMDAALAADPERREAWELARDAMLTQLFELNAAGDGFENPRTLGMVNALLAFAQGRLAVHEDELEQWSADIVPRAERWMSQPLVSTMMRFLTAVESDPEARDVVLNLVGYLVDEASDNDAFDITLVAALAIVQAVDDNANWVPLMDVVSRAIVPNVDAVIETGAAPALDEGVVGQLLDVTQEINDLDETAVFQELMANLVSIDEPGGSTPLEVILDVIGEVNRADVSDPNGVVTSDDVTIVIARFSAFLTSDMRGLERLFDVVQQRELQ